MILNSKLLYHADSYLSRKMRFSFCVAGKKSVTNRDTSRKLTLFFHQRTLDNMYTIRTDMLPVALRYSFYLIISGLEKVLLQTMEQWGDAFSSILFVEFPSFCSKLNLVLFRHNVSEELLCQKASQIKSETLIFFTSIIPDRDIRGEKCCYILCHTVAFFTTISVATDSF